jgi:hypothetical protein
MPNLPHRKFGLQFFLEITVLVVINESNIVPDVPRERESWHTIPRSIRNNIMRHLFYFQKFTFGFIKLFTNKRIKCILSVYNFSKKC